MIPKFIAFFSRHGGRITSASFKFSLLKRNATWRAGAYSRSAFRFAVERVNAGRHDSHWDALVHVVCFTNAAHVLVGVFGCELVCDNSVNKESHWLIVLQNEFMRQSCFRG